MFFNRIESFSLSVSHFGCYLRPIIFHSLFLTFCSFSENFHLTSLFPLPVLLVFYSALPLQLYYFLILSSFTFLSISFNLCIPYLIFFTFPSPFFLTSLAVYLFLVNQTVEAAMQPEARSGRGAALPDLPPSSERKTNAETPTSSIDTIIHHFSLSKQV